MPEESARKQRKHADVASRSAPQQPTCLSSCAPWLEALGARFLFSFNLLSVSFVAFGGSLLSASPALVRRSFLGAYSWAAFDARLLFASTLCGALTGPPSAWLSVARVALLLLEGFLLLPRRRSSLTWRAIWTGVFWAAAASDFRMALPFSVSSRPLWE